MKTFLTHGAFSNIYLDTDDKHGEIIIKESRAQPNSEKYKEYMARQLRGYDVVNGIRQSGNDFGVVLPELISVINGPEQDSIIEKRIKGADFNEQIYKKLSEEQKEDAAHQMALFLNAMHQMQPPKPADKSIKSIFENDRFGKVPNTSQQFSDVFNGRIAQKYMDRIKAAEQALMNSDISDEIHVMTHKDIRNQNIMYDTDTGQMAVIDFEMAGVDNIYRDFIAEATASSMPWDFTRRVIKYYNAIPNKKYQITIDADKVKNALIYGVAHEYSRILTYDKMDSANANIDTTKRARNLEHKLNLLFGEDEFGEENFAKKLSAVWARGISKIKDKSKSLTFAQIAKNMQDENSGY